MGTTNTQPTAAQTQMAANNKAQTTTIPTGWHPPVMERNLAALTEDQSKSCNLPFIGLMAPGKIAQSHPAGPLLQQFAELGCPMDISEDWTL